MKLPLKIIIPVVGVVVVAVLGFLFWPKSNGPSSGDDSAAAYIQQFYGDYLAKKVKSVEFSEDFRNAINENRKLCDERAKGEICGFGAHGDPYLNAQDWDDNLTIEKMDLRVREISPEVVEASFTILETERLVSYSVLKENGKWVVDDIKYDDTNARSMLQVETELLKSAQ